MFNHCHHYHLHLTDDNHNHKDKKAFASLKIMIDYNQQHKAMIVMITMMTAIELGHWPLSYS